MLISLSGSSVLIPFFFSEFFLALNGVYNLFRVSISKDDSYRNNHGLELVLKELSKSETQLVSKKTASS